MRFAVLTDIHANREAFAAVLADAATRGAERIALLGDLVGYGPDPAWCVDKAARLAAAGAICIQGKHDSAAANGFESLSADAKTAMAWTKVRSSMAIRPGMTAARQSGAGANVPHGHADSSHSLAPLAGGGGCGGPAARRICASGLRDARHRDQRIDLSLCTLRHGKTVQKLRAAALREDLVLRLIRGV